MRTSIIRIGNSQGISGSLPRNGWSEKLRLMAESGDDKLLDDDASGQTEWDKEE